MEEIKEDTSKWRYEEELALCAYASRRRNGIMSYDTSNEEEPNALCYILRRGAHCPMIRPTKRRTLPYATSYEEEHTALCYVLRGGASCPMLRPTRMNTPPYSTYYDAYTTVVCFVLWQENRKITPNISPYLLNFHYILFVKKIN